MFKHVAEPLTVFTIPPESCHIRALSTEGMFQRFENMRPYSHPLSPIPVNGDRYALPADFVNGLAFLRPLLPRKGDWFDTQVNVLGGKLYLLTTSLVIEYDAGSLDIPDWWFSPETIRMLEAFKTPPIEVHIDRADLCFQWHDEQEFFVHEPHLLRPGSTHRQMAVDAFAHYRHFNQGVEVTNARRRDLRRMHGGAKLAKDIYLNDQEIVSRMSGDGKTWTSETSTPFLSNADRTMRFDRKAFLDMIRVADEINFSTSPICFRHAHGRGVLVERTLGSDIPTFGGADD